VRKTDDVLRYGGDEFVIVFDSIPTDVFEKTLERIRRSMDVLEVDGHSEIRVSVSIGGAYGLGKANELFKVADNMMYQAKAARNQVSIYYQNPETYDI
jgi:putative two-component system response regulator